jgi:calcyphosin
LEELAKGAREFGATLNAEQVQQLFQSLDKDGSGSIDFNELLIALRVINFFHFLMKLI